MKKVMFAVSAMLGAACAMANVELGTPFSDNMVLQRDRAVPVWGRADAGEKVTVAFAGQAKTAIADATGAWKVMLDAMPASKENRVMKVSGSKPSSAHWYNGFGLWASKNATNEREIKNVLVGEVWFASGQSNMECPIWGGGPRYRDGKGAMMIQATRRPLIRWAKNPKDWKAAPKPAIDVVWRDYSPESFDPKNGMFLSAVAYYYALELYSALEIPIGIIDSSWGGTNIDAWTPRSGWENHPELKDVADFPVTGKWDNKMRRGVISGGNQQPSALWNGMVAAWTPFAIRGFIWYQGCHNNGEARRYCSKMHALYDGWAKEFQNPDLKLYFVELAPFSASWFELQRSQMKFTAEEKNAAIAVTCDAGNIHDIHPNDKEIVAKRLALHALKRDYGFDNIRDDSPTLKSWKLDGNKFVMTFNDANGWYVYSDDRSITPNFEIAGKNGKFVPAKLHNVRGDGNITGTELVVSADEVAEPVRLRYLAKSPYTGTLYNDVSLPLGPFDIDARTNNIVRVGPPVKLGEAEKIPELAGFRKIYTLDVPTNPSYKNEAPAYSLDKSAEAGDFSRVAYLYELENFNGSVDWAMTSMDAFTKDAKLLGVPCRAGNIFQTKVANLTVRSNIGGVKAVTDFDGGNIEFWPNNYGTGTALAGIGGDKDTYDFNDIPNPPEIGYGAMQVHNWKDGIVVWVLNNFNSGNTVDAGIGNNEFNGNPDWTFMGNGTDYKTRRLTIYVK
ncbi:MAG: hypothetical protein IJU44_10495 [Kiritimatiellae bacterium]|nr:hypothetical protein [Kiritimatiellia bacterium]